MMPNDGELKQKVFENLAVSNIMDDQMPFSVRRFFIRDKAHVLDAPAQIPKDDISRLVIPGV